MDTEGWRLRCDSEPNVLEGNWAGVRLEIDLIQLGYLCEQIDNVIV